MVVGSKTQYGWCSIVAGLGQLRSGAGTWRGSSSSSRSSEPAAASSDDGGSSTEAARTQQLANLLHRRAANDLQVLTFPFSLPPICQHPSTSLVCICGGPSQSNM